MRIAGVDEVGRGPLAGPVVAAVVVFESGYSNPEIKDSKQLSKRKREQLVDIIKRDALAWSIVSVGSKRIDKINILQASRLAMSLALRRVKADQALIDGNVRIEADIPQETIVGGDALRVEIGAASIIAKVYRDKLMEVLDKKYPGYDLAKHAGYPTKAHKAAISKLGPARIHRRSFRGVLPEAISTNS